jgi:FkbM family methyltransferase
VSIDRLETTPRVNAEREASMIEHPHQVVEAAYQLLLNREPDAAGLKHWSSALAQGLPTIDFVRAVLASAEFRSKVPNDAPTTDGDVDLIIPVQGAQLRVPASDLSLVPHLLKHRSWEPHIANWLAQTLRPEHVFVDVGANIGYFTVLCAPLVSRVVAFEPGSSSFRYCRENVKLNGLQNVELHPYGLWHESATLRIKRDDSSLMTAAVDRSGDNVSGETIRSVALDEFVGSHLQLSRLDVVKMDIEGAELSALRGMTRTLARFRPAIVMELNRPALAALGSTVDEVWGLLTSLSYQIHAFAGWDVRAPEPVSTLSELKARCPDDTLIDIVAIPAASART